MDDQSTGDTRFRIRMVSIGKEFPGVTALRGVDFQVKHGEIRALAGENGAGKSTLMKVLSGVFPRSEYTGTIWLNDREAHINNIGDAEANGIAMITQETEVIPELSVGENIFLNHEISRAGIINWDQIFREAEKILQRIKLSINVREPIRNFSPAVQRIVSIAGALSRDASILILDEPTAALTEEEINTLYGILAQLKEKGVTIIFISHKLSEIFQLCDSVTVMRDGEVVGSREIHETKTEEIVEMMTGRKIGTMYPKRNATIGEKYLEIRNFSVLNAKTKRHIVKDASFYARKGEVLGVFGLVGSGRTELFMSVYGLMPKNLFHGDVLISGRRINIRHPSDSLSNGIGLMAEDRKTALFGDFSVCYNVSIANLEKILSSRFFVDEGKEARFATEYVNRLSIKVSSLNQLAKQLSGGNQQKVLLARWLAKELSVVIFDEPTRGIDVGAKVEIYRLMNEMASRGIAVVFISSELPEILGMSDRILVVHRGSIRGELQSQDATAQKILNLATGGLEEDVS